MAVLFLIACVTLVAVSGRNLQSSPDSLYHYSHASKPDPNTAWNFASHLNGEEAVPAVDAVPSRPDLNNEEEEGSPDLFHHYSHASKPDPNTAWNFASHVNSEDAEDVVTSKPSFNDGDEENSDDYDWQFSPLVNNNKDYLYDYVGDNWLLGEESPYYYYSEGKGSRAKVDGEEVPSKHRRKYRRSRSLAKRHKRKSGLNNFNSLHEARPARKTSQFESNRMRRSIKLGTPNFLTNAEKVHPTSDLQFTPTMRKREVQLKTANLGARDGRFLKHRVSRTNVKRRRRQLKAHQLEYFTDNDGDSQFHAPGKAEGTEWDLVPLEALKDDNEEELGIQYDKKASDASLLISE